MHEYFLENEHTIDPTQLQTGFIADGEYSIAHRTMCFACHDVLIRVNGKYLLVNRDNLPAKNILWPIGGRVTRGVPVEKSLSNKALKEAGLTLTNIRFLGVSRTLFETDPWGHGKGTDTLNLMYAADGQGEVKLDQLHSKPRWVSAEEFSTLKTSLHPYVVELFEKAFST